MATWKKVVVESAADTIAQDTTGNAGTATALESAITIGGVSFDGTANINLPGVDTSGSQDTSGNAATATALAAGRNFSITGDVTASAVSFDGTGNVALSTTLTADSVGNAELDLVTGNTASNGNILSYDGTTGGGTLKWVANTAAANDSTLTLSAGAGLSGGGTFTTNQSSGSTVTFAVDFGEFTDTAVTVADDYIVFLDGSGTGAERKESIADLVTAMTGTNLASQAGVIQLTTNPDIAGTLDVTGVATFDSNVTIAGNLTVTGSTTTVESTNLLVDDTFISLNDNAAANADTGIVFGGADNKVFGWDNGQESGRFGVDYTGGNAAVAGGGFSADGWVSVAHSNSAAPTDSTNGDTDSLRQIGNIYVNSTNQDIYIYS